MSRVVFIAVGTLVKPRPAFPAHLADVVRGVNYDTYESAEQEGTRYLDTGHWSTFTVERRYYPSHDVPDSASADQPVGFVMLSGGGRWLFAGAKDDYPVPGPPWRPVYFR